MTPATMLSLTSTNQNLCGVSNVPLFDALLILLGCAYLVQLIVVFAIFFEGDYRSKVGFIFDLIPFSFLIKLVTRSVERFIDLD